MKLIKTASGKQTVKMSKVEWQSIGKTAGWMKEAEGGDYVSYGPMNFNGSYGLYEYLSEKSGFCSVF